MMGRPASGYTPDMSALAPTESRCIGRSTETTTAPTSSTAAPGSPYVTRDETCWHKCGEKYGQCPSFCGDGNHCCMKGRSASGCTPDMSALAPTESRCIGRSTGSPYVTRDEECWKNCGQKYGQCPSFCGDGNHCCMTGRSASGCTPDMSALAPTESRCIGRSTEASTTTEEPLINTAKP